MVSQRNLFIEPLTPLTRILRHCLLIKISPSQQWNTIFLAAVWMSKPLSVCSVPARRLWSEMSIFMPKNLSKCRKSLWNEFLHNCARSITSFAVPFYETDKKVPHKHINTTPHPQTLTYPTNLPNNYSITVIHSFCLPQSRSARVVNSKIFKVKTP